MSCTELHFICLFVCDSKNPLFFLLVLKHLNTMNSKLHFCNSSLHNFAVRRSIRQNQLQMTFSCKWYKKKKKKKTLRCINTGVKKKRECGKKVYSVINKERCHVCCLFRLKCTASLLVILDHKHSTGNRLPLQFKLPSNFSFVGGSILIRSTFCIHPLERLRWCLNNQPVHLGLL